MGLKLCIGLLLIVSASQLSSGSYITYLENPDEYDTNCSTPLHDAVLNGSSDDIQELIENGADMYALDCHGLSAMHLAVKINNIDMINELANNDFDVSYVFENGETVIFFAVRKGSLEAIDALVTLGSDVTFVASSGNTPLLEALQRNESAITKLLGTYGAQINMKYSDGDTILHIAAQAGKLRAVLILLDNYKMKLSETNDKNETPLYKAVVNNHPAIINLLISRGAVGQDPHKLPKTYVYIAVESGSLVALRVLLENNLFPETKNDEKTPLSLAVSTDCLECAKLLVKYGADINRLEDGKLKKMNYLHSASLSGSIKVISFLIESGLDVNSKTEDIGNTPLHIASAFNQLEAAKILLSNRACRTCKNLEGNTPLDIAASDEMRSLLSDK